MPKVTVFIMEPWMAGLLLRSYLGIQVWEKQPWKEPGGPNEGRKWYDQKFAWHLSPPSVSDGKLFFGSFPPSFHGCSRLSRSSSMLNGHSIPGWPSFETDYKTYRVGRDGFPLTPPRQKHRRYSVDLGPRRMRCNHIPPVADGAASF